MKRFWEIDFVRGIAIVMMIASNFKTDLDFFGLTGSSPFWQAFARITASIFIFLVGVSLVLSYSRARKRLAKNELLKKYLYRGIKIFSGGLAITAVTWFFLKGGFVVFGVLHLIGLSIVLAYPLLRFKYINLMLGVVFAAVGIHLNSFLFGFPWLLWLGLMPAGFYSVDYFPVLPWFGLVLIGTFFGNILYPEGCRRIRFEAKPRFRQVSENLVLRRNPVTNALSFLGKNSLLIYLVHQPVLIALIILFLL